MSENQKVQNQINTSKYSVIKDKKILGSIFLILSFVLLVFGEIRVPIISSIPRYTTGMFLGYFNPCFYIFTAWIGLKMLFPNKIRLPKWLNLNWWRYWIIVLCLMLIVQAWGWAAATQINGRHIVTPELIGGQPWSVAFKNWFKHFSHHGGIGPTETFTPNNYYGGVVGFTLWSTITMVITPIGTGIFGILGLAISISLIATGSFVGLFKKISSKKRLELKLKESKSEDISDFIKDDEASASPTPEVITNDINSKEDIFPFEDPFAEAPEIYEKIRPTEVLSIPKTTDNAKLEKEILSNKEKLNALFATFDLNAKVTDRIIGHTLTKYIVTPCPGVNIKKFAQIESNIKMTLASQSIRMELPIPGHSAIGIEVPNTNPEMVSFKEVYDLLEKEYANEPLAAALGKTITGEALVIPINKTPHLLVAGATGSGKSVGINAILMSMIMRTSPEVLRLVLVDPKMVEFMPYNDVPHLLCPVITDPIKAAQALEGVVDEMERRFQIMSANGVRNLEEYNKKVTEDKWPYIVVVIDELADLMNVAAKLVETSIQRITQKARAAGIHLIVATQRPSVNVVTGTIKANIPSRISFSVTSGVDSKVILDEVGAEKLMGKGDLLMSLYGKPIERCQGAYISNDEIQAVINKVKNLKAPKGPDLFAKFKKVKKDEEDNKTKTDIFEI